MFFDIHIGLRHFLKKVVARLTEHDDVIKHCSEGPCAEVLHWAPHLLGPALKTRIDSYYGCAAVACALQVLHRRYSLRLYNTSW